MLKGQFQLQSKTALAKTIKDLQPCNFSSLPSIIILLKNDFCKLLSISSLNSQLCLIWAVVEVILQHNISNFQEDWHRTPVTP